MSTSEGTVTCTVIPEIWPIFLEWFVCIHDRCKYMFRAIQPSGAGATDALFCCISHLAQTHKPSTAPWNKSESSVRRCLPWFWLLWWKVFFCFLKTDRRTGKKIRAASRQKAALWCKSHFQTFIGVCCRLFWLCQPLLCVSSSFEDWEGSEHTPFRVKWKIPICPVLCISLTVRSCCLPNHRPWNWSPLVWITGWQCWAKMEGKMEEGKDERRTVAPCTYSTYSTVCSQKARCECWQATISSLKQLYGEKLF